MGGRMDKWMDGPTDIVENSWIMTTSTKEKTFILVVFRSLVQKGNRDPSAQQSFGTQFWIVAEI